ncbi:MAG: glycine--tRNA ligase [SAR202 cluster bacterium]|nr:glycine--tRNA ligase [SAR202 cluster bacterium]RZP17038.1 MAG: glycine--tRNA ligase [Chloroflexota bacterium]
MSKNNYRLEELEKLVSLAKRRGIIFPSSEIYGGLSSVWDYGPIGVEIKRNVKNLWWKSFVSERDDIFGIDASILMHPDVWKASGHLESFSDPLVECSLTGKRYREDHIFILEIETKKENKIIAIEASDKNEAEKLVKEKIISIIPLIESESKENPSPDGGTLSDPRNFNLMFKTFIGPVEDSSSTVYLRPETAQAMFVNFLNVLNSSRKKIPFGIAQQGKSFRNEITPGNFTFRTREFEQMEMEFFCSPDDDEKWHDYWIQFSLDWFKKYGIREENLMIRKHESEELPHYSKASSDIDYLFPWSWGELETISNRTDYDLKAHSELSGKDLSYFDQENNKRFTPYVIEPAMGADRSVLAFLCDAYCEEETEKETRTLLKLHPEIAPIKIAVLPLSRNEKLSKYSRNIFDRLNSLYTTQYDDTQSIGRRYRRQDEVGTPLCVTIDFESVEEDDSVTIRNRDTMEQIRVSSDKLLEAINDQLKSF